MCIYCFKMAEENEAACALLWNYLFIPSGRVSPVWKHFGYKKDSTGSLVKGPCTYCKLCFQLVARGGGTINLRSHLCLNHLSEYSNLFTDEKLMKYAALNQRIHMSSSYCGKTHS